MNLCFALLDRAIIAGHADDPILRDPDLSHARLLEDVAAVGGVLRAVGVSPGDDVAVTMGDDVTAVTAALAVLRVGARLVEDRTGTRFEDHDDVVHLVWQGPEGEAALDWLAVLKAGRTDPAPAPAEDLGEQAPALPELPLRADALLEFVRSAAVAG